MVALKTTGVLLLCLRCLVRCRLLAHGTDIQVLLQLKTIVVVGVTCDNLLSEVLLRHGGVLATTGNLSLHDCFWRGLVEAVELLSRGVLSTVDWRHSARWMPTTVEKQVVWHGGISRL